MQDTQETRSPSPGQEEPLELGMANQYARLENSADRRALGAIVCRIARLSAHTHTHTHTHTQFLKNLNKSRENGKMDPTTPL